jgi:hypothetical protein
MLRNVIRLTIFLALAATSACDGCHRTADGSSDGGAAAPAASAQIGVSECDSYLTKYADCVSDRVPAGKQRAFEDNLARTRASWKALAANPGARPGLPQACALALETARTGMQEYGCVW